MHTKIFFSGSLAALPEGWLCLFFIFCLKHTFSTWKQRVLRILGNIGPTRSPLRNDFVFHNELRPHKIWLEVLVPKVRETPSRSSLWKVTLDVWLVGSSVGMTILPAGSDIRWISDPSGTGSGTKYDPWVLPVPDPILLRVGCGFDFLPAGTRRISENSDFRFSTYQYAS
jgi:hypothetical protein